MNKRNNNNVSDGEVLCKYCLQAINAKSKVCHHCGKDQRPAINKIQYFASSTALIMVVIAAVQTNLTWVQMQEAKAKKIEIEEASVEISQIKNKLENILSETKASSEKVFLLQKKLEETAKSVAPPEFTLENVKIEKGKAGLIARIRFKSKSPGGFHTLPFKAKIVEGTSKITLFFLDMDSSIPQTNIGVEHPFDVINPDGKSASTEFLINNSNRADLRLDVSSPAKVLITGKYLKRPTLIDVR